LAPRHVERNTAAATELGERVPFPGRRLGRPGLDGALEDRPPRIGDDQVEVEIDDPAEAAAGLAGAEGTIEGEEVGNRIPHREAAGGALECGREALDLMSRIGEHHGGAPPAVLEGLLEGLDQTALHAGAELE